MRAILKIGRFQRDDAHMDFLKGIQSAGRKYSDPTPAETTIEKIKRYLRLDLKKHAKPKDDGLDPKSIVLKEAESLQPFVRAEIRKATVECRKHEIRVVRKFLEHLEHEVEELSEERGSPVFLADQRAMREAKKRIAEREAQQADYPARASRID